MDEKALALLERIASAVEYLAEYHGRVMESAPAALEPEQTSEATLG